MADAPVVPMLDTDQALAVAAEAGVPDYLAKLHVFRVLLHHPGLSKVLADGLATLLFKGAISTRVRELQIMRIGWLSQSAYEWGQHWNVCRGLEVDLDDVADVRTWHDSDRFSAGERAVLAATDEAFAGRVTPQTWSAVRADYSDDPSVMIEVVAVAMWWRAIAVMLESLAVPLDEDLERWAPDGTEPTG